MYVIRLGKSYIDEILFTVSAHWADSVYDPLCLCVCLCVCAIAKLPLPEVKTRSGPKLLRSFLSVMTPFLKSFQFDDFFVLIFLLLFKALQLL